MHRAWNTVKHMVQDERGIEGVEFLGFVPIVLLTIAVAWQFILIGYTAIVAATAAREGARAAVTLEDIGHAVASGSPGFDERREWSVSGSCPYYSGNPVAVTVRLEVPHVGLPFLGEITVFPKVTAVAAMRCEPPFDSP